MKFGYSIVYVKDVLKTVDFYERAFGIQRHFIHESNQYAEMATGSTLLAFSADELVQNLLFKDYEPNASEKKTAGMELDFVTDDVKGAYQQAVKAGAKEVIAPVVKPWGQTVGYVRDINGITVAICSPIQR